jgi:hypothetical protein
MTEKSDPITAKDDGVHAKYYETEVERVLVFEHGGKTAAVAQNIEGYAMLKVREDPEGGDVERYYGFDMALDHAAELLDLHPRALPIPDVAADMGI